LLSCFSIDLQAQAIQPKIDVHMHARTSAYWTETGEPVPIPCMPDGCVPEPAIVTSDEDVMGLAIESMRRNNIVLGIVTDADLPARSRRAGPVFTDRPPEFEVNLRRELEPGVTQGLESQACLP
jgi:hypothetical protein